jgi:hypothetical protein
MPTFHTFVSYLLDTLAPINASFEDAKSVQLSLNEEGY